MKTWMKRLATILGVLCLTSAASAAPGHSGTPAQARREIRRLYQVFDAMYDTHNAPGEMALYLPTFVGTDQQGHTFTYAQIRASVTEHYPKDKAREHQPNGHTTTSFQRTTPMSIQLRGDHATVRWAGHSEALAQGGGTWGHVSRRRHG